MDPQMRKLLEVSWEAWMDSGVDVNKLKGSDRVGVYIGCCGSEVLESFSADVTSCHAGATRLAATQKQHASTSDFCSAKQHAAAC